jgi:hypothetical protein
VALVRTDVSEEPGASFIRVTKIGELGTTQAATSNRRTVGVTTQKTPFFIVTAMKTSNLRIISGPYAVKEKLIDILYEELRLAFAREKIRKKFLD